MLQAEPSGVVVVSEEMEADNDAGGSLNTATEQAAVQSSRQEVESEPLLFLGGLPVTLSPRPARTAGSAVPNPTTVTMSRSVNKSSGSSSSANTGSSTSEIEYKYYIEQA
jgi:hypothetical protein